MSYINRGKVVPILSFNKMLPFASFRSDFCLLNLLWIIHLFMVLMNGLSPILTSNCIILVGRKAINFVCGQPH